MLDGTTRALTITCTILGVPYYNYIIKAPILYLFFGGAGMREDWISDLGFSRIEACEENRFSHRDP